ncbi:acylphosphatase [Candidatus Kaiserbacteria bacterium]|nr:acylphosphatase [Candidatus Kaiserbacteria bacterium]
MIEMKCIVHGKVQGVRFRDYVQHSAGELGIFGWVKNDKKGTVIICAQGSPDILKEFVEYLHEGSVLSEVTGVEVEWGNVSETYNDFSVLH